MTYTHKMLPLAAQYDQAAVEKKWQAHWLSARTYAWDENIARSDSYVIDTPPPTVSGTLHMGHVFSYTQADFIARFQRMNGKNVFYPMGFDDNGLPTERLVEKTKKIRATDMSREDFINVCLGVSEEARVEFRTLFQSIALSVDWDQEYHTISDDSRRLSQLSFLDLIQKEQAYRAQRPFYWDPVDQTAIASAEIEDKELPSFANDITFTCEGKNLTIMTTRPELLPACVALFCHPDDTRYTKLHGKQAQVPLCGFSVPILIDDTVDMEKGTGLMMCCTFGDDADIVKWQKHKLPVRVILNKSGKIDLTLVTGAEWPTALSEAVNGKKVSNPDPKHLGARQTIIQLLKDSGLLVSQKQITHAVKCAERSGAPLEILPTSQWFVKVTDKKDALQDRAKECSWNPEWMRLRIEQWIDGLNQDWCISRQRYFGVPFPVWYKFRAVKNEYGAYNRIIEAPGFVPKEPDRIYADISQLPVNPMVDLPNGYELVERVAADHIVVKCHSDGELYTLTPDFDVMDTWATSSISPQLSAHGINAETAADKNRFAKLYPADLRPQAHEIIRTWAFYTLVKSHLHSDSIPWKNLMISGWCLAEDKSKMSKSKGNVITPVALIEERGTDAVRYWAGTSRLGQDTAFSPDLLKIGKKLVGKLWNATAFAAIHLSKLESAPTTAATDITITETLDRWILSRLGETIHKATDAFMRYEYADALDATNQFFWADFCDNYLELIKKRVYNEDGSASATAQQSAVRTLYYVLDGILKLYAPFTPHVTEELYSHIFADAYAAKGSLHAKTQWPNAIDYELEDLYSCFDEDEAELTSELDTIANQLPQIAQFYLGELGKSILEAVRSRKSHQKVSIKFPVSYVKIALPKNIEYLDSAIRSMLEDIKGAGNIETVDIGYTLKDGATEQVVEIILASVDAA